MLKIAVLNVLFLVVGLVFGAAMANSFVEVAPDVAQPDPASGIVTGTESGVSAGRIEPGAAADSRDEAEAVSSEAVSSEAMRTLAEALRRIPARPAPGPGAGKITGVVLTADGRPIEGAAVRAFLRSSSDSSGKRRRKGQGAPEDRSLEDRVVRLVHSVRETRQTRRISSTDRVGEFALTGLQDDRYSVRVYARGHEIEPRERSSSYARPGDHLEFVARAIVKVPIDVVMPGGEAPSGATVRYRWKTEDGDNRTSSSSWSAEDPFVGLYSGTCTLSVTCKQGDQEYRSDEQRVTLVAGTDPERLRFELAGRLDIKGKVIFAKGEELESASVLVIAGVAGQEVNPELWKQTDRTDWVHRRDLSFHFRGLEPGTYHIGVARDHDSEVAAYETVEVSDGTVRQDLEIPPLEPWQYVVVWALGPDGKVLGDVEVRTGLRTGTRSSSGSGVTVKREDGATLVLHHEDDGDDNRAEEDLRHVVFVTSPTYGKREVEYRRGETSEIRVQFVEPATLEVMIAGYAGSGREGTLSLSLEAAQAKGPSSAHRMNPPGRGSMDALGRMEFGPVEPGEYEVVVSVKADRHSSRPASRHPVVLVAGANRVEVPVPVLHTLTVLFPEDVAPGSSLRLRSAESRSIFFGGNKKVGKDGRVVYESLPSGEFSLTTYGGAGSGQMTILLDRDLEVRFEPEVINALRVRIDNPEGSLARAGFQSGDLVVGFDQVEFESMLQMRAAFAASMSRKSASFTVLRGDRRVEIPVEPRKLMGGGDQGGSMEPASR